jgi:hypothetical protein
MSTLKRVLADPGLAVYYGQKLIRSPAARAFLGNAVSALAPDPGPAPGPVGRRALDDLLSTGFAPLPEKTLDADRLAAIHKHFGQCDLIDYHDGSLTYPVGTPVPPTCKRATYDSRDTLACRPLMDLANDPDVLAAVGHRLGCKPTLASAEAWWTFGENNPEGRKSGDDIFHRDLDGIQFLKLFAYLTDVQVDNGAHCFVLRSHRSPLFTGRGAINDEDVERSFSRDDMMVVTGKAGTAFLEETWGIHRPLMARRGRRLIFSAIYTVRGRVPWAKRSPLPLPAGLDGYVNRHLYARSPS